VTKREVFRRALEFRGEFGDTIHIPQLSLRLCPRYPWGTGILSTYFCASRVHHRTSE
jgi:hypothetical protein